MTSKIIRETLIKTRNEIIDNIIMLLSTQPGYGIIFNKKNHASTIKNSNGGVCALKSIHMKDLPPIISNRICQAQPSDDKLIIKTYLNKDFSENDFDIEELLKLLEIVTEANEYEERIDKNSKRYWKLTDLASWIENHVFNGQHFGDVNDKKYWGEILSNWKHGFADFYEAIQDSIDRGYLRLRDKLVFLDEMAGDFFGFATSEELYDYFEEEIKDAETDIAAKLKSNSI